MAGPFSFLFIAAATFFHEQAPSFIYASDGIKLAYYQFMPKKKQPESYLVFYHGGGAWSNKLYQYMASQLAEKHNIGVYLFDIRGHGHSEGPRGDAPSIKQVWRDITSAITFVHSQHPVGKIFLGGHSSGAGLVVNYSNWSEHVDVDGYLLLTPFLGVNSDTAYEHTDPDELFVRQVNLLPLIVGAMTSGMIFGHRPAIFFNYPEMEKRKDTHLLDYYTSIMSLATTPHDAAGIFAKFNRPVLLMIGCDDEQFRPARVASFNELIPETVGRRCRARMIVDAAHLTLLCNDQAHTEMADFINSQPLVANQSPHLF